jgi:hypothetical protein
MSYRSVFPNVVNVSHEHRHDTTYLMELHAGSPDSETLL